MGKESEWMKTQRRQEEWKEKEGGREERKGAESQVEKESSQERARAESSFPLSTFLSPLGLDHLVPNLLREGIRGVSELPFLAEHDLRDLSLSMGERARLRRALADHGYNVSQTMMMMEEPTERTPRIGTENEQQMPPTSQMEKEKERELEWSGRAGWSPREWNVSSRRTTPSFTEPTFSSRMRQMPPVRPSSSVRSSTAPLFRSGEQEQIMRKTSEYTRPHATSSASALPTPRRSSYSAHPLHPSHPPGQEYEGLHDLTELRRQPSPAVAQIPSYAGAISPSPRAEDCLRIRTRTFSAPRTPIDKNEESAPNVLPMSTIRARLSPAALAASEQPQRESIPPLDVSSPIVQADFPLESPTRRTPVENLHLDCDVRHRHDFTQSSHPPHLSHPMPPPEVLPRPRREAAATVTRSHPPHPSHPPSPFRS